MGILWESCLDQLLLSVVLVTGEHTDGLESLAETHVVTEDAVELILVQERKPVDSLLLVLSEVGLDLDGDRVWL